MQHTCARNSHHPGLLLRSREPRSAHCANTHHLRRGSRRLNIDRSSGNLDHRDRPELSVVPERHGYCRRNQRHQGPCRRGSGTSLTVRVKGIKAGYATAVRESAPTAIVVAGTLVAPTPTITGTLTVGSTLIANPGTWTSGTTLTYQWYRSGVAIPGGATARSYKLVSADQADAMSVRVTGTKAGYTTVVKYSASTTPVQ